MGSHTEQAPPRPVPTDPRQDSRPEAESIFSKAFVDVPRHLKDHLRKNRRIVSTGDVKEAWRESEWGHFPIIPLNGGSTIVPAKDDFLQALPHLGTSRIAYHAQENFVCRNYSTLFASVVAAELWCNVAMVCDDSGHHMYSAVPVLASTGRVEILVIEPQGDTVVPHTDPTLHYTGQQGFAIVV